MKILQDLRMKFSEYVSEKGTPDFLLIHPEDNKEVVLSLGVVNSKESFDFLNSVLIVSSDSIKFGKYCYAKK